MRNSLKKAMKRSTLVNLISSIFILAIVLAFFTFVMSTMFNSQVGRANEDRYALSLNANRFMDGSAYLTSQVRSFAATGAQVHFDNYWNEINNLKNRDLGVAAIKQLGITMEEQELIDQMSALSNQLVPLEDTAMKDRAAGNTSSALDALFGSLYEATIAEIVFLQQKLLSSLDTRSTAPIQSLMSAAQMLKGQACTV